MVRRPLVARRTYNDDTFIRKNKEPKIYLNGQVFDDVVVRLN